MGPLPVRGRGLEEGEQAWEWSRPAVAAATAAAAVTAEARRVPVHLHAGHALEQRDSTSPCAAQAACHSCQSSRSPKGACGRAYVKWESLR